MKLDLVVACLSRMLQPEKYPGGMLKCSKARCYASRLHSMHLQLRNGCSRIAISEIYDCVLALRHASLAPMTLNLDHVYFLCTVRLTMSILGCIAR
ncbi:hypothetical protein HBH64_154590 [Parastagonospora nodorum]|nr:hypothetical protein HBH42_135740 [Parastagonospora nodorum]KAH4295534.1 hypothetical protein HBI01_152250 [Parastagonospora nodorum]KAH4298018.1 hypothetical protein HBI02_160700 [Parastagonospora nodorum]KAH4326233.1 hypothetical protein HBI00_143120 [Parastagonospora nodorum]KAH4364390.1 hypothetical protein HBH94_162640 [Parastagonospora nodorum]